MGYTAVSKRQACAMGGRCTRGLSSQKLRMRRGATRAHNAIPGIGGSRPLSVQGYKVPPSPSPSGGTV